MNERTRREGSELFRREVHWPHAKALATNTDARADAADDAKIREALDVVLGWAELLSAEILESASRRRAVDAIERNARVLRTLPVASHAGFIPAVEAALRRCADLRASGRL